MVIDRLLLFVGMDGDYTDQILSIIEKVTPGEHDTDSDWFSQR